MFSEVSACGVSVNTIYLERINLSVRNFQNMKILPKSNTTQGQKLSTPTQGLRTSNNFSTLKKGHHYCLKAVSTIISEKLQL